MKQSKFHIISPSLECKTHNDMYLTPFIECTTCKNLLKLSKGERREIVNFHPPFSYLQGMDNNKIVAIVDVRSNKIEKTIIGKKCLY